MFLTGEAAEYAEELMQFEEGLEKKAGRSLTFELDEKAQKDLFQITFMYERDVSFQKFIRGCLHMYSIKVLESPGELSKMIRKVAEAV